MTFVSLKGTLIPAIDHPTLSDTWFYCPREPGTLIMIGKHDSRDAITIPLKRKYR